MVTFRGKNRAAALVHNHGIDCRDNPDGMLLARTPTRQMGWWVTPPALL
ncbi:MAG: hypothetical protein M3122_03280 [Actinomycetota bacterium]|nr:hypothetical protein [Actinomycetota bacterium]